MGKWLLTPSLRVATFSHVNKRGHEVLVESDGKTKLCRHGEMGSSIRTWVLAETRARAEGLPLPARNSPCDCCQTLGLQSKVDTRPPTPPPSVYDLLVSGDGEAIELGQSVTECRADEGISGCGGSGGGKAYRLGIHNVYLGANGGVYCQHGHRLRTRTHASRPCVWSTPPGVCKCHVVLPRRMPHIAMVCNNDEGLTL